MARRLIIDTGVLIASERGRTGLVDIISEDDDLVVAAITVAELRTGIELASTQHRAVRAEFLLKVLDTLPVEPYDLPTAEVHGRLLADVHRSGRPRGAHHLIIAATVIATKRAVLTTDRNANFHDLPASTASWRSDRPPTSTTIRQARAGALAAAYEVTPERFVRKQPEPLPIPIAAWINRPDLQRQPAH